MKKLLNVIAIAALFIFATHHTLAGPGGDPKVEMYDISQSVLKMSLAEGISREEAVNTMLSKAAELNMKMVGHLPVSKELASRGQKHNHLEIYQFCNPEDAIKMVEYNPIYAAYMPCRIALVEDKNGVNWLLTLNLDMLISKVSLPPHLRKIAIEINGQMIEIMTAAATGEF